MTTHPAPAPGSRLFFLADEGILFSEKRQELHALNTAAAVIWCLLEEGRTDRVIAEDLSSRFAISLTEAFAFVSAALADWQGKGLLAGSDGPQPPAPSPSRTPLPCLPPYPAVPPAFVAARSYRLLTTRFAVRFATAAQMAVLHPLFAHLEDGLEPDVQLDLVATGTVTILYRDGNPLEVCASDDALAPTAYACIWMSALRRHGFFLNIHAGVLGMSSDCVLLPAPPGSGKSILTAALVHAGFDYFSDEVALLSPGDLRVAPFPQAICLKESGIAAVAAFRPEAASLLLHRRCDGKRVAYLPPPPDRLPHPETRGTVRALVFPRYKAGAAARCKPLAKTAALARLLGQCTVIEGRLDAAAVGRLVAWVGGLECREIVYGATADGVAAVNRVMAELRSSRPIRNTQTAK